MPEILSPVVFERCRWVKNEPAVDAVFDVMAAYHAKHDERATVLLCNSGDLTAVSSAATALGLPPNTQAEDTVVWTRRLVPSREVWAGRRP